MSGRREDTFYQPSSDESFALSQRLQYLAEEACSSRFIRLVDKYQYDTQLRVVNKSWKEEQQLKEWCENMFCKIFVSHVLYFSVEIIE